MIYLTLLKYLKNNIRIVVLAGSLLCLFPTWVYSQNVLGDSPEQVMSYFKINHPDLVLESNFRNDHYKYLKYTDGPANLKTVLIFMNKKDKCTSVRLIYDFSLEDEVLDNLNNTYQNIKEFTWIDNSRDKRAVIVYKKEDWFITINIKEE